MVIGDALAQDFSLKAKRIKITNIVFSFCPFTSAPLLSTGKSAFQKSLLDSHSFRQARQKSRGLGVTYFEAVSLPVRNIRLDCVLNSCSN
jgi:hypothetical protein